MVKVNLKAKLILHTFLLFLFNDQLSSPIQQYAFSREGWCGGLLEFYPNVHI